MSLFIVAHHRVSRLRNIPLEQDRQALDLQKKLAKPAGKFKPEQFCDLIDQADAMATTVFCPDCRFDRDWKIGTRQCNGINGCNQWFCSGHIKGNHCQTCQELHSLKSARKSRGKS